MATTQPIRNKNEVRSLATYFIEHDQLRNHVLIVLSVHTALRISDLLRLTWDDIYDFERGHIRETIDIVEKKTAKPKTIALHKEVVNALSLFAVQSAQQGHFLIDFSVTAHIESPYYRCFQP